MHYKIILFCTNLFIVANRSGKQILTNGIHTPTHVLVHKITNHIHNTLTTCTNHLYVHACDYSMYKLPTSDLYTCNYEQNIHYAYMYLYKYIHTSVSLTTCLLACFPLSHDNHHLPSGDSHYQYLIYNQSVSHKTQTAHGAILYVPSMLSTSHQYLKKNREDQSSQGVWFLH